MNRPSIKIRPLKASDFDRVVELERELFGRLAWTYGMLVEELRGLGRWYIVAELDPLDLAGAGPLVGYAGLWFDGEVTQIMTLGTAPEAQRQGIGRVMLEELIHESRRLGATAILLEVHVDNTAAITLYESRGFTRFGIRRKYYAATRGDAYTMRLDLSPQPRDQVFITPEDLAAAHNAGSVDILDVRWELGRHDGHEQYVNGHIPGAVYVDLDTELADPPSPERGRHPLPSPTRLQEAVSRWGIRAPLPQGTQGFERTVVVYDAVGGLSAARAWWLLRWAGYPQVRILDGGLAAWQRWATQPGTPWGDTSGLERGTVHPQPGDFIIDPGHMPVIDADGAVHMARTGVLLDARATARYTGETEPIDPRAGHIPGATSAPTTGNLDDQGQFLADQHLQERWHEFGVHAGTAVGVYCGSGVTAAHQIAALASIGVDASLYPGSWSQWSHDDERPVATGSDHRAS